MIRTSENAAAAKERLISVFDLSEIQADYILDMPLRRLTKFSRLELEKEKSELERTIEQLDAILADDKLLRKVVADELTEVAKTYGTPRRTVLLESAGAARDERAYPSRSPTTPVSSTSPRPRCSPGPPPPSRPARARTAPSTTSSCPRSARPRAARWACSPAPGAWSGSGCSTCPPCPPPRTTRTSRGGAPLSEFVALAAGERALALTALPSAGPGLALGTRQGVVKRVNPEVLANRDDWEVIRLAEGDEVVGALDLATGEETLCFITSDAQLLHFGADAVRPQGRAGGGIAGVRLAAGESVAWFGAVDPADSVVVTASGSSTALPGTEPGAVKVTPFSEYPPKGRATGGVRCHRFLKGEDALVLAWAGTAPARAAAASGAPVDLPDATGRRDGSGIPGTQPIVACAGPVAARLSATGGMEG